jgi:hypothetical protein
VLAVTKMSIAVFVAQAIDLFKRKELCPDYCGSHWVFLGANAILYAGLQLNCGSLPKL